MLYVGATVLSLLIMLAFALSLAGYVRDELEAEREDVQLNRTRVMQFVNAAETRVRIVAAGVANAAMAANPTKNADESTFRSQGGKLVIPASEDSKGALILQLPSATPPHTQGTGDFLAAVKKTVAAGNDITRIMNDAVGLTWGPGGYVITPSASVVAVSPLPNLSDPRTQSLLANRSQASIYFHEGIGDLALWAKSQQNGETALRWISPQTAPLSVKPLLRIIKLVVVNDKPFAVVAGAFDPQRLLENLDTRLYSGTYSILDEHMATVTTMSANGQLSRGPERISTRCETASNFLQDATDVFSSGKLWFCAPLGDTGWKFAYESSLDALAGRVARDIAGPAISTGLALILLWCFVSLFNRKILTPLFERSERVFESEHLSRTLIETVPVGLALVNLSDTSDLLESAHMLLLKERFAGGNEVTVGELLKQHAPSALLHSGREQSTLDEEFQLINSEGKTIHIAAKCTRSFYQGHPVLVVALSDVTAERELVRQLAAATQAAKSASLAKSAFLASMSHEIRTPLNAILGHVELLERAPLESTVSTRVRTIASSSRGLLHIVDDVLDFSKVEAGEMTFESVRFDIDKLIRETTAMFTPLALKKGLTLTASLDPGQTRDYMGDPKRIGQVIANLLGNAIKFTHEGEVSISQTIESDAALPLVIRVADTGIGIPAAQLNDVFRAFNQIDASVARRFGGTGLGLALCKRLVEEMGGAIDVDSMEGQGSVFSVRLALLPADSPQEIAKIGSTGSHGELHANEVHVLVAEDDEVNRELIRDQLDALGYMCDIVENGLVALRNFNEVHYDIVLTDLNMPVMDGYTFAECLKNQGQHAPVIAITADITASDSQRIRDAGITGVLLKPMSLESLDSTVRKYLNSGSVHSISPEMEAAAKQRAALIASQMHEILEQQTTQSLSELEAAIAEGDKKTALSRLHSIKGGFAMLHLGDVAEMCAGFESALEEKSGAGLEEWQKRFITLQSRIAEVLGTMGEPHAPNTPIAP